MGSNCPFQLLIALALVFPQDLDAYFSARQKIKLFLNAEVPYFEELDAIILAFLSFAAQGSENFPAIDSAFLY